MKPDTKLMIRVTNLTLHSLNGTLNDADLRELEELLEGNPLAIEYYAEVLWTHVGLNSMEGISSLQRTGSGAFDYDLWRALAEDEKVAPEIFIEKPAKKPKEIELTKPVRQEYKISKLSLYTLVSSVAAVILFLLMVLATPDRSVVGVLTDSIDAHWMSEDEIPVKGEVVRQGKLTLTRGLAEITFSDGAVVLVEAPAVVELESAKSMFVSSGKVTAVVSEYATGFTVNTLGASIVDLGTEFGVSVGDDGSCTVHMFKGLANLIVGREGQKRITQQVHANQAKRVDLYTGVVKDIKIKEYDFIRSIDSEQGFAWRGDNLNLADIVGGGDGFGTGKTGYGYDITTGQQIKVEKTASTRSASSRYNPVANRFIDGVFVPDGGKGSMTISSTGLLFADCPDTTGRVNGDVFNGAWHNHISGEAPHFLKLKGRTFEKPGEAICMNSNKGITFDLDAIRDATAGVVIKSFKSYAGVSESVLEIQQVSSRVDFWVLVDGDIRLKRIDAKPEDKAFDIDLPITEEDRFLTLITTDSGIEFNYTDRDWALFAEPVLELELKEQNR